MTDPQAEHVAAPLLERAEAERAVMERTSVTPPMLPPIDQIAPREWAALLAEGTVTGTVSADDVARVMAEVELTEDVIAAVRAGLAQAGILVDEEVELEDITPTKGLPRPEAGNGDRARWLRRRSASLGSERGGDGGTSDTVRLYLKEIGRVSLLTGEDERELAQRIESGQLALERMATSEVELPAWERRRLQRLVGDGEVARAQLIQANLRLVVSIAKRYVGPGDAPARPGPGGQPRPDAGGREVRPHQGLQVLDLRHVVDPPGHHAGHRRPGPHHPHPGPHGREHEPGACASSGR